MIVGKRIEALVPNVLLEVKSNKLASEYIIGNYESIVRHIRGLGIHNKAEDLLHDVFISIMQSENNGEGFDIDYREEHSMSVAEFVYGRVNGYAKNKKYSDYVVELGTVEVKEKKYASVAVEENGNIVEKRKSDGTKRASYQCEMMAATPNANGSDENINDRFQDAYANASVKGGCDEIEEMYSIVEDINICIDICSLHNYDIMGILRNIEKIDSVVANSGRQAYATVFEPIKKLVKENSDLAEALRSTLEFSMKHKDEFNAVLGSVA